MNGRLRLALSALRHGPQPLPVTTEPWLPRVDAWGSEERCAARREAALGLFDEDVCGFFLLTFHRDHVGLHADLAVSHVVDESWWPAVAGAVERVRCDR